MKIASLKPLDDGIDEQVAENLWNDIEGFAAYSFNRSHTVEYSLISWQSMWLKTHYPVEFFAACLTLMDQDKLPAILRDASRFGIDVNVPDVNVSSGRFEIITDARMVMPFNRIKGVSSNATNAILEARKAGPFTSKADFLARVNKTKVNSRVQDALDKVGAFARLGEPGQVAADDPSRILDQLELLPGLITAYVPVNHDMERDKFTREKIADVVQEYKQDCSEDGVMVQPYFGKSASFMIITDAPTGPEEQDGEMSRGRSVEPIIEALEEHDMSRADAYFTAMIKRPKAGKQVSNDEIDAYWPYLEREIQLLNPPVIVLMGTGVVRKFIPDFTGKASDAAGKVVYSKELDANLVIGFNVGEVYYAPEKQELVNNVIATVVDLIG